MIQLHLWRVCLLVLLPSLAACSTPNGTSPGWWSRSGQPGMVPSDTTMHRFLLSLTAQGTLQTQKDSLTAFFASKSFFDCPDPTDAQCFRYYPNLSGGVLQVLVRQQYLQAADTVFMQQQQGKAHRLRLRPALLPGCQVVPADTLLAIKRRLGTAARYELHAMLLKRYQTRYFYDVSIPLFSHDLQTAIFDITLYCGNTCGGSETVVVRRQKQQWQLVRSWERWAS